MYANNETGSLLPIAEIGRILKDHPAAYHVDAVQAYWENSYPSRGVRELISSALLPTNSMDQKESDFFMLLPRTLIPTFTVETKNKRNGLEQKTSLPL